jgi:glycosyltransferase involved in cell wall biosynthesis
MDTPDERTWLSIVIPTYNRKGIVRRAIDSCLQESVAGCEIVVVDDASTDETIEDILRRYKTDHLRAVRLHENVGVCGARMAGVEMAKGEWVLFLDSDDELLPGALLLLQKRCREAAPDVARLALMYLHDGGEASPEPWAPGAVMDYPHYLRWAETVRRADFSNCIRRTSFDDVKLPLQRSYETGYHLDFAERFSTLCCGDIIARVHADAAERLTVTTKSRLRARLVSEAEPRMSAMRHILDHHGEALRRHSPKRARMFSRAYVTAALVAGHRSAAMKGLASHLWRYPLACSVWGIALLGTLCPRALCWAIAQRRGK